MTLMFGVKEVIIGIIGVLCISLGILFLMEAAAAFDVDSYAFFDCLIAGITLCLMGAICIVILLLFFIEELLFRLREKGSGFPHIPGMIMISASSIWLILAGQNLQRFGLDSCDTALAFLGCALICLGILAGLAVATCIAVCSYFLIRHVPMSKLEGGCHEEERPHVP